MPTRLTRVDEILRSQISAAADVSDAAVTTTCPSCKTRQDLGRASVRHEGADTTYTCIDGCQPIVVVSDAEAQELPGRGHRFDSLLIRNVSDLEIAMDRESMTLRASPAALEPLSGRTRKYRI
jgi:hypothetical protein